MRPRPAPVTDSPLFWLLLFGSVGLLMLAVVEPKFAKRQERIERMYQSRQSGRQAINVGKPRDGADVPAWQATHRATLRPLMLFLATLLVAAMVALQVRRQRSMAAYRRAQATHTERKEP